MENAQRVTVVTETKRNHEGVVARCEDEGWLAKTKLCGVALGGIERWDSNAQRICTGIGTWCHCSGRDYRFGHGVTSLIPNHVSSLLDRYHDQQTLVERALMQFPITPDSPFVIDNFFMRFQDCCYSNCLCCHPSFSRTVTLALHHRNAFPVLRGHRGG
ncbi:PDZ domain-containing protein [Sesbania bispinosa]|nr:PDZ domain-containing protein [Sesbania bispinosa]